MSSKAKVAKVDFGFTTVEGLLLANGEYAIGMSQLASLKVIPPNRSITQLVAITGMTFPSHQSITSELHSKKVNCISLIEAALLIKNRAKAGVVEADLLLDAILFEGLERRFDIAFDNKRSEEEYNARLKARVEGKQVRWDFTDSIKAYIERNNITGNEAKFMYKNATDKLYSFLTGYSSTKKFREKENIPLKHSPRDYASERDLKHIAEIEAAAQRWIDIKNIHPYDAVELVTNQLLLSKIGWNKLTRI
jgi:hypothetical protein